MVSTVLKQMDRDRSRKLRYRGMSSPLSGDEYTKLARAELGERPEVGPWKAGPGGLSAQRKYDSRVKRLASSARDAAPDDIESVGDRLGRKRRRTMGSVQSVLSTREGIG